MKLGELFIRNGHSDKTIMVKPGDTLHTEDGRLLEVVLDDCSFPCKSKCAIARHVIHLNGGGYICCATFGCVDPHGDADIHLEVKGGEDDK